MNSDPTYSIDVVRALFEMMGTYGISIVELPGGLKIVKSPDAAPTLQRQSQPEDEHPDSWLYSDGRVPSFK